MYTMRISGRFVPRREHWDRPCLGSGTAVSARAAWHEFEVGGGGVNALEGGGGVNTVKTLEFDKFGVSHDPPSSYGGATPAVRGDTFMGRRLYIWLVGCRGKVVTVNSSPSISRYYSKHEGHWWRRPTAAHGSIHSLMAASSATSRLIWTHHSWLAVTPHSWLAVTYIHSLYDTPGIRFNSIYYFYTSYIWNL